MITLTYERQTHPEVNQSLNSLQWGLLKKEGWDIEYENVYFNRGCGLRATKQFPSLVQALSEWETITNSDPFKRSSFYSNRYSNFDRQYKSVRKSQDYIHLFLVDGKKLTGDKLMRTLRQRF